MTMACEESKARSFKSVPGWVKFHYPHRSRSSEEIPQELEKALPPLPHSTTASGDEKGHHMASDNGDESAGAEQAVFGRSGLKQVQMGWRISGASAHSLLAEKQEAW